MIEDTDGDLYLVEVGFAYFGSMGVTILAGFLSHLLSLGVFAIFLAYRDWLESTPAPTPTAVGYGLTLLVFVLAYPYLLMLTKVTPPDSWYPSVLLGLPVLSWGVILTEIWRSRGEKGADTQVKHT